MKEQIIEKLNDRIEQLVRRKKIDDEKIERKHELLTKRKAKLVKVEGNGKILSWEREQHKDEIIYSVHLKYVIKQNGELYVEEEIETRKASFYKGDLFDDEEFPILYANEDIKINGDEVDDSVRAPFTYDRLKAVQYAERWWNDYNPQFEKFDVDCTNYISQCLYAGGAPMRSYPDRSKGWWYRNKNWSYSWSVANALKTFFEHSKTGLRAKEVKDPRELKLGDVICYDFQGDGRFDHNTIVTAKDANGEPLVNAHTYNSRMRYWAYEDSSAYTPNIQYKMFNIIDDS